MMIAFVSLIFCRLFHTYDNPYNKTADQLYDIVDATETTMDTECNKWDKNKQIIM